MNAFVNPIVVQSDGHATTLPRLKLSAGAGQLYDESWLQGILYRTPSSLPVTEIDPHTGSLIPVCMELRTDAGPADILYVTRTGKIVLVETKLWRNVEARRVVVAQILDYAKELSQWRYEDLARASAQSSGNGPGHLLDCVLAVHPDLDEAAFVDGINRSLETGDFILIIAGDGIRSGAESLVGFIDGYANLRFKLALVEVAAYQLAGGSFLLQPRLLVKTVVLQRTVFVQQSQAASSVAPASGPPPDPVRDDRAAAQMQWLSAFWEQYLHVLRLDDSSQPVPRLCRTTNLSLPMPPSGSSAWISIYLARGQGHAGVYLTFARAFPMADAWFEALLEQREAIEVDAPELSWERQADGKIWISFPTIHIGDPDTSEDRTRVIQHLADQANRMVNAFRHRLDTLARAEAQPI